MRRSVLAILATALASCVTPPASPEQQAAYFGAVPDAPSPEQLAQAELITGFAWASLPNPNDYVMVYPRDAWSAEVQSRVTLECIVQPDLHVACAATDDQPLYNFEQAARNLSTRFVMQPLTNNGVSVVGRRVKLLVWFRLAG